MNVQMAIYDIRYEELARFFSTLRDQGIPILAYDFNDYYISERRKFVSSKQLISRHGNSVFAMAFTDKMFYARDRDVSLILLMAEYRITVLPRVRGEKIY